jgi:hypothetical protein
MEGFLQTAGLLVCLGIILVVALGAFAFRRFFGSRTTPNRQRGMGNVGPQQGTERPRHDSSRVESSGGFGSSGSSVARRSSSGARSFEDRRGEPGRQPNDRARRSPRDRGDNPRSGGFGSG